MPDQPPLFAPILVVGAAGQVGTQLVEQIGVARVIATGRQTTPPPHLTHVPWRAVDLQQMAHDADLAPRFLSTAPQLSAVICVAGATDVDRCESEPDWAASVNANGPAALAAATPSSTPFVYFSTEYIFDGGAADNSSRGPYTEDSAPHALSVYGRSKLLGEQLVQAARPDALILRTTVVYGADPARKNFLYFLHRELSAGKSVRVVTDQISTPTSNDDLARATLMLLEQRATGIFHVCGPELLSRFEFAVHAAQLLGLDSRLIHPITTSSLRQRAPRPLLAGLRTDKLRAALGPDIMKDTAAGVEAWAQRCLSTA